MGKETVPTEQRNFRLSDDTIGQLDEIAKSLTEQRGLKHTRTDAIRHCAKEVHEEMFGKKKSKKDK